MSSAAGRLTQHSTERCSGFQFGVVWNIERLFGDAVAVANDALAGPIDGCRVGCTGCIESDALWPGCDVEAAKGRERSASLILKSEVQEFIVLTEAA